MIYLTKPSEKYKQTYLEALEELRNDKEELSYIPKERETFPQFIERLHNNAKGKDLPEGWVPDSTYWLIDNDQFIGRVSIRHVLNKALSKVGGNIGYDIRPSMRKMGYGFKILEYALVKAKEIGLEKVLVTCNDDNIGSKKIIEKNGGIFQDSIQNENLPTKTLRYWIPIA